MKKPSTELLSELTQSINQHIILAENLNFLSDSHLNTRLSPEKWTILECLQHLILYGNFYIPEIQKKIDLSRTSPDNFYKSTILGNWFANQMLVSSKTMLMKTSSAMNPIGDNLGRKTIDEFISQQNEILRIIACAESKNLNRIKIKTSILPLAKINLGDALRFVINHIQRHLIQIENIYAESNYFD